LVLISLLSFSVIDPLYPPDRQVIYLDVAQPRALIIIDKATQDAGPLSGQVRSFIKENLKLRTEVPGLKLQDDGTLLAGRSEDGSDIFASAGPEARTSPNVEIGPDDTPTLSFTSGSEGRPKGVAGRHYSLAKYFPWMAERFNLSEKDRFTMLSGIAHDVCNPHGLMRTISADLDIADSARCFYPIVPGRHATCAIEG
jgi:L-2-aminoadipate reductase